LQNYFNFSRGKLLKKKRKNKLTKLLEKKTLQTKLNNKVNLQDENQERLEGLARKTYSFILANLPKTTYLSSLS
jgi:hypothetical protein